MKEVDHENLQRSQCLNRTELSWLSISELCSVSTTMSIIVVHSDKSQNMPEKYVIAFTTFYDDYKAKLRFYKKDGRHHYSEIGTNFSCKSLEIKESLDAHLE